MPKDAPVVACVIHGCPYCKAAVKLLRSEGVPHRIINIGNNAELMIRLSNETGSPTVPKIFVNEQFIGGFSELEQLVQSGEIMQMVGQDGAVGQDDARFGFLPLRGAKRHR